MDVCRTPLTLFRATERPGQFLKVTKISVYASQYHKTASIPLGEEEIRLGCRLLWFVLSRLDAMISKEETSRLGRGERFIYAALLALLAVDSPALLGRLPGLLYSREAPGGRRRPSRLWIFPPPPSPALAAHRRRTRSFPVLQHGR